MFEGALGKTPGSRGRVWAGAVISVGTHAALVLGALWLTQGPATNPTEEDPEFKTPVVITLDMIAQGRPQAPARPAVAPPVRKRKPLAPRTISRPVEVEPSVQPPEPEDPVSAGQGPVTGGEIGEGPRGLEQGSCEGPGCLTEIPQGAAVGKVASDYDSRMTAPVLLSGEAPEYSREAREAQVQGTMIVKCVIALSGRLENCRVIKPLPHMEEEILGALATRRYKPVTLDGQPLPVNYVFHIRLEMPR